MTLSSHVTASRRRMKDKNHIATLTLMTCHFGERAAKAKSLGPAIGDIPEWPQADE